MIVILKNGITQSEKENVKSVLKEKGFIVKEIVGENETVLGAVGSSRIDPRSIEILDGVSSVVPISKPYKLASRELKKEDTIVTVRNVRIGGNSIAVIAGPCAVESQDQVMRIAEKVRESGAVILRGGAFKPRTSPYSFQGLGIKGLEYLKKAGEAFEMPITSEVVSPKDVEVMKDYVDMFQIGARNMQNFELLKEVGKTGMPVLLKRGIAATIEEWLMAAEYVMSSGSDKVVLCERGIRTYEKATRNTLDCSAIPVVQKLTHLPVIGDPSHATGIRDFVSPMALALVAAGASGLTIEVHDMPEKALSDGPQSLYPEQFDRLMRDIEALAPVVGKTVERVPRIIPSSIKDESAIHGSTGNSLVVAFQGERGAFSELAARRGFSEDVKVLPEKEFKDVFKAVNTGDAKYGVVPIENTLGGTIYENCDLLRVEDNIEVVGEITLRVIHNLIVNKGVTLDQVKHVYSHPQGLAQCRKFLERKLPNAILHPFFDTAGAVSYIKKEGLMDAAAIAGSPAAMYNDMEILEAGIETDAKNYTRFFIITRRENAEVYRSSIKVNRAAFFFSTPDEPGALFKVLDVLEKNEMNMKKLESRPILGKPWEYSFFVEVEIDKVENLNQVIEEIKALSSSFRLIGTYAAAH